jgi:hypothetical protein
VAVPDLVLDPVKTNESLGVYDDRNHHNRKTFERSKKKTQKTANKELSLFS